MKQANLKLYYFRMEKILREKDKECYYIWFVNPLPDDKILGLPKLKAFADDKLNVTQNVKGGLQILGRKFYKILKKSSLYS